PTPGPTHRRSRTASTVPEPWDSRPRAGRSASQLGDGIAVTSRRGARPMTRFGRSGRRLGGRVVAVATAGALLVLSVGVLARPTVAGAVTTDSLRITNVTDPVVRGAAASFTVELVQGD